MRKDYFRDLWTIIAPARGERPKEFADQEIKDTANCPFCPGNEHLTPPEITRVSNGNSWQVRVFPNRFSILEGVSDVNEKSLKKAEVKGNHELVIETPIHTKRTSELEIRELKTLLEVFRDRAAHLSTIKDCDYIEIFKNFGPLAGASIIHNHFQIISLNKIPPRIEEKISHSYGGDCAYCHIVEVEEKSKRKVFENNHFVSFVPYAPQNMHELWIVSKKHLRNFDDMDDKDLLALAEILKNTLTVAEKANDNYNMIFNIGPKDKSFHFHIEIFPQSSHAIKAGFELGTGISVVASTPEDSAKIYRGEI
ncbi:MAG: Galactose-1-phosphate uridylyltransferase [candidate division CPR2 bacterium GW2011_GWC1_41_48]|uniref:Galactose-1-phosphate uridylyltransferase n=1 Tax=candidate division CPR2 bacterium GW2011_GWC1_41_48 TaxID=1618344 RepID=A0A0G0Z8W3_UNCC2|nr:MAG: Galactose-1-phosphate uridylyltransferase [candidate division CPR2 bacterium GW2011_GWC2_39_35]KKR29022.1 MAG: Galactose-1-phosphate uridylyltransferase [candidate division CPR2 bacterium GW2011_GWD2_39_7]KKS09518.1 MAG: Galactose-1-phosphate uridylyltransferase [candidate division CPR2 bacterium GW2011_GWC1_41_48]OGB70420.1 MAG: hypothetical protein A2Y26_00395 [candidate division CPR2 bacterium GWD2_39_7]